MQRVNISIISNCTIWSLNSHNNKRHGVAFLCTSLLKSNCTVEGLLLPIKGTRRVVVIENRHWRRRRRTGDDDEKLIHTRLTRPTKRPSELMRIVRCTTWFTTVSRFYLLPSSELKSHLLSHPPPPHMNIHWQRHPTFTLNNSLSEWVCTLISAVFSTHVRFSWRPVKQISN